MESSSVVGRDFEPVMIFIVFFTAQLAGLFRYHQFVIMSSFGGHMREYVDISLDRFDGGNLDSTVYFLSHKHEDHMVGLSSSNFQYRLQSNSHIKLYVSDVTRDLLLADDRFTGLAKSLVVHELEVPFSIPVPDPTSGKVKYHVTVTLVPAAHCPGSVMFLFEGTEGTALYTGDFRLARGDISRVECLKSAKGVKAIDSLYIDTTFCVPEAFYIPSREDCTEAILGVVARWTALSPGHVVLLYTRAALGYEHLFVRLAEHFKTKIHLSNNKYDQCKRVKAFPEFGTCDGTSTQIHACKWVETPAPRKSPLPCGVVPGGGTWPVRVKRITVSTMWFTQRVGTEEIIVRASATGRRHHLRACYSFHSSYSEVRDVVTYLNPRRVFPNVIPMGHTEKQIQERLNNFLKLVVAGKAPSTPSKPRLLGTQRPPQKRPFPSSQSTDSDLIFDESPRKPKKKRKSDKDLTTEKTDGDVSLKWESSENHSSQPNSQLNLEGLEEGSDADINSSYVNSQQTNASAMELVGSDFEVTPKKPIKKDSQSTPDSIECIGGSDAPSKQTINGVADENSHSEELFSDGEVEEDKEVLSVRKGFKPYKDGSYGSHVTYASDVDFSDGEEVEDECVAVVKIGDVGGRGDYEIDSVKEPDTKKCQSRQNSQEDDRSVLNGDPVEKQNSDKPDSTAPIVEKTKNLNSTDASQKGEPPVAESSDKSISIEETVECSGQNGDMVTKKAALVKWPDDDEDEDDDVIMLDSDEEDEEEEEEGEVPGVVAESMSEGVHEETVVVKKSEPQPSTSKVQEVIDLTAEDDEEIVSMGVSRFHGEEGDGYHGDSESELNDTDGIMTDSDSSFAKASYEKTKTRMSAGKSRRATIMNGFSSSDSDTDTDLTIDESLNMTPIRYPIAGSCHYSKTRLNGFYSTLVDNEVIVLDDKDDDPPPNVTIVDIANKDQQVDESKTTLASAEDLVSGAMAMASAATAANNSPRLLSTIQRLKKNITKPVLATPAGEPCKQTARKSTSAPRFSPKKPLLNKSKSVTSPKATIAEVINNGDVVDEDGEPPEGVAGDLASPAPPPSPPSQPEVAEPTNMETSQSHKTDCSVSNDSGKIAQVEQGQSSSSLQAHSSDVLLR